MTRSEPACVLPGFPSGLLGRQWRPEVIVRKRSTFILSVSRSDTVDAANESVISKAAEMEDISRKSKACLCYLCCCSCCTPGRKKWRGRSRRKRWEQNPYDLFFFFFLQIDQHRRKPFGCRIRCIASACTAIFIHDCGKKMLQIAFFYTYKHMSFACSCFAQCYI